MRLTKIFSVLALVLFLGACSTDLENEVAWTVEAFDFTNQNNEKVSNADLEGKVWVANFIFTNCATVCPPMTANMSRLQKLLEAEGIEDVELVSFSVDPEVDTPEMLAEYAENFTDNTDNWQFLTGYAQAFIEQFARESFKAIVAKSELSDQVAHYTDFYLVDQNGTVVKYYDGLNVPYDEIISDIKIVQKRYEE